MGATIVVVAGLITREGRILIAQRPEGKKRAGEWEFPGGKAEPGETPQAALERELMEELGVRVIVEPLLEKVEHEYPDLKVEVFFFPCTLAPGAVVERREHARIEWIEPARMTEFTFVEADRALLPRFVAWASTR
ncbi:MAG TPA: (deoxy)nucleoside triphosphate pyrophosphohydrolase [bacterium]|nr:(deoxy)nucleoside triphosphate pyrophosphohydrolase [bacterium]